MKRKEKTIRTAALLLGGVVISSAICGSMDPVRASILFDMDTPIAGIAVPLNNFYASSLNPEEEIKDYLTTELPAETTSQASTESQAESSGETQPESSAETQAASAEQTTAAETTAAEQTTAAETQPETTAAPEPSPYDNIAITQVKNYVNIRKEPNTSSEIVGKIANNAAATILETVDGEDGQWYKIKSGSVEEGYMKAEFFVTGQEAENIAKEVGNVLGKTTATTLRLREEPSTEARTLSLLANGDIYPVEEENIIGPEGVEFVKVLVSEGDEDSDKLEGYVASEYIDVYVEFEDAVSVEEERKAKEEAERKQREAEEAKKKLEEAKKKAAEEEKKQQEQQTSQAAGEEAPAQTEAPASSTSVGNATRDAIVARAMQFVGNLPYVYGGSSLSSGADCSGFTSAIFAEFGISLARTSRGQASGGTSIDAGSLQPGDLVFYANSKGTINHVAIYIGGGQIVHEANSRVGCAVASMNYSTPVKYVRYIN